MPSGRRPVKRVLVVEDDDGIRGLVRGALEPSGYEVIEAEDGRQGLRALYEARPDVVVLDTTLPEIDGWEALERLRDFSDAPVIVLAPMPRYEDVVRALKAGLRRAQVANEQVERFGGAARIVPRHVVLVPPVGTRVPGRVGGHVPTNGGDIPVPRSVTFRRLGRGPDRGESDVDERSA